MGKLASIAFVLGIVLRLVWISDVSWGAPGEAASTPVSAQGLSIGGGLAPDDDVVASADVSTDENDDEDEVVVSHLRQAFFPRRAGAISISRDNAAPSPAPADRLDRPPRT